MGITPPPRRPHNSLDLPVMIARAPHGGSDAVRGVRRGFLALLLALVLAAGLVPTAPSQAFGDVPYSGTDGGCTWEYNARTASLTIAPSPGKSGYLNEAPVSRSWRTYSDSATSIIVEDGVFAKGNMQGLFAEMVAATSITLPENFDQGITNMSSMFSNCQALETILLPNGFGSAGTDMQNMFSGCQVLKNISLPGGFGSVTENTQDMFSGCQALESVTLPEGFGNKANVTDMFLKCSALSSVKLGQNCNENILAQVPADTWNDYLGTWVRRDEKLSYNDGKLPSELPDDYERVGKLASEYMRQHVASTVPPEPQAGTSVKAHSIGITILASPPVDAFVFYSLYGDNWQEDPPRFMGLSPYTAYGKIQVRYSGPAYKNASTTTLSATTLGLITYEPNGGSGITKPTEGKRNDSSALAAECAFTRAPYESTQYKFKEWNTSSDGTGTSYQPGEAVDFERGGNTLYAVWKEYRPPHITTTDLPFAMTGELYSQALAASGTEPVAWSVASGELPAGLSLSADGIISGTPSTKGASSFAVEAANDYGADTADFSITVVGPPVITVSDTLPATEAGKPYRFSFASDDNSASWSAETDALPDGLSLAPDGKLSGTPHDSGFYTFSVKATNEHGSTTQAFHLAVSGHPVITTSSLPDAAVGSPYSQKLSATGYPETFTWTLKPGSTLPEGLSLSADGIISGTPCATGTATITVQAANGVAPDAAKELSLKVNDRKTPVALVATGDDVAGPTAGLVALLLFCAASITVLSLRLRARRR